MNIVLQETQLKNLIKDMDYTCTHLFHPSKPNTIRLTVNIRYVSRLGLPQLMLANFRAARKYISVIVVRLIIPPHDKCDIIPTIRELAIWFYGGGGGMFFSKPIIL